MNWSLVPGFSLIWIWIIPWVWYILSCWAFGWLKKLVIWSIVIILVQMDNIAINPNWLTRLLFRTDKTYCCCIRHDCRNWGINVCCVVTEIPIPQNIRERRGLFSLTVIIVQVGKFRYIGDLGWPPYSRIVGLMLFTKDTKW